MCCISYLYTLFWPLLLLILSTHDQVKIRRWEYQIKLSTESALSKAEWWWWWWAWPGWGSGRPCSPSQGWSSSSPERNTKLAHRPRRPYQLSWVGVGSIQFTCTPRRHPTKYERPPQLWNIPQMMAMMMAMPIKRTISLVILMPMTMMMTTVVALVMNTWTNESLQMRGGVGFALIWAPAHN